MHPRYGTPARLTLGFGLLIAVLAAFVPLTQIVQLVNIGTLFAFVLVNLGVIILRRTRPDMPRPFKVPFSPVFPIIGILLCVWLMSDLPFSTWIRFVVWLIIGLVIYRLYSYKHSRLRSDSSAGSSLRKSGHNRADERDSDGRERDGRQGDGRQGD